MNKQDFTILGIALVLVIIIAGVASYAHQRTAANVLFYDGPGGHYRIDIIHHGTSLDYYVHTTVNNQEYIIPFSQPPNDVANVTMQPGITDKLERPAGIHNLYITQDLALGNLTDQDSIIALTELAKVLGRAQTSIFKLNYHSAFTTENNHTIELAIPAITCTNITNENAVILLRLNTETSVTSDSHDCIIIQGTNGHELLRATYKFLYRLIGIF